MGDTAAISTPVRAIIADDHPLVLLAIENLIGGYPSMEVVGRAADATELFAEVDRTGCDLVLMDLYMPGGADGSGVEAVRQFRRRYPDVALIVLTMETEAAALQSVISLGVDALISKRDRIDLIHVAIVTALAGECYLGPAVRTSLPRQRRCSGSTSCARCCRGASWKYSLSTRRGSASPKLRAGSGAASRRSALRNVRPCASFR